MSEDMAKRIRELRRERGYTLEKIAKDVGVGKSTVRKWETGIIANMRRDKIAALAQSLNTTPAYLMGWDDEPVSDDTNAIALAKDNLSRAVENNPDLPSGKRLEMLFDFSDFDHIVVCFNLGIDQTYLNQWMDNNNLPPKPIIDKILGVFHIKPEDLLPDAELAIYRAESAEWDNFEPNIDVFRNVIKIAGRDGSYQERVLSDQQLAALKALLDQLPDASDDL